MIIIILSTGTSGEDGQSGFLFYERLAVFFRVSHAEFAVGRAMGWRWVGSEGQVTAAQERVRLKQVWRWTDCLSVSGVVKASSKLIHMSDQQR